MDTAFIARLLDESGALLAWAKIPVVAKGDGCLYPASRLVPFSHEQDGFASQMSFHWADVNVEWRVPVALRVEGGLLFRFDTAPLMRLGAPPAQRLPPVTVGSVVVTPGCGAIGASGA